MSLLSTDILLLPSSSWWAQGALTVLPQPQLQGAFGTVIAARFEQAVSHSLSQFLPRFYTFWAFQDAPPCTRYVFYVEIQMYEYFALGNRMYEYFVSGV